MAGNKKGDEITEGFKNGLGGLDLATEGPTLMTSKAFHGGPGETGHGDIYAGVT